VQLVAASDPSHESSSRAARALWAIRWKLGDLLGWVADGAGGFRGQMAVYVKPNGLLGNGYMAAIRPFRHLVVYPPMVRQIAPAWRR
jgi:Protein of unknown function (DUF2867)